MSINYDIKINQGTYTIIPAQPSAQKDERLEMLKKIEQVLSSSLIYVKDEYDIGKRTPRQFLLEQADQLRYSSHGSSLLSGKFVSCTPYQREVERVYQRTVTPFNSLQRDTIVLILDNLSLSDIAKFARIRKGLQSACNSAYENRAKRWSYEKGKTPLTALQYLQTGYSLARYLAFPEGIAVKVIVYKQNSNYMILKEKTAENFIVLPYEEILLTFKVSRDYMAKVSFHRDNNSMLFIAQQLINKAPHVDPSLQSKALDTMLVYMTKHSSENTKWLIQQFVERGFDVNQIRCNNEPFLSYLAMHAELGLISYFLGLQPNVNIQNSNSGAPLHFCCAYNSINNLALFLQHKADPNLQASDGNVALHYLINRKGIPENERQAMVRLLLENKADPNLSNRHGDTPLHIAAENGLLETARILIENGAKVTQQNSKGLTPLSIVLGEKREFAEYLIAAQNDQPQIADLEKQNRELERKALDRDYQASLAADREKELAEKDKQIQELQQAPEKATAALRHTVVAQAHIIRDLENQLAQLQKLVDAKKS